jgi:adenylosuccinate lyase
MNQNLNNISPVDGRYAKTTKDLNKYFSEAGLIRYRVYIEVQYFIHLYKAKIPQLQTKRLNIISKKNLIH